MVKIQKPSSIMTYMKLNYCNKGLLAQQVVLFVVLGTGNKSNTEMRQT